MTDHSATAPLSCVSFKRQIFHFQADELPEVERRRMCDHLDACPDCARRLQVEDAFLRGLKTRMRREKAPEHLRAHVKEALKRQARAGGPAGLLRTSWLAAAAALLLALLLIPSFTDFPRSGWGVVSGVMHVKQQVMVVDLDCDKAGYDVRQQRGCRHPDHLNGLKLGPGNYWNLSLDDDDSRAIVVDEEMRGHVLEVEGDYYARIRTLHVTSYRDRGLVTETTQAVLLPAPGPRGGLVGDP